MKSTDEGHGEGRIEGVGKGRVPVELEGKDGGDGLARIECGWDVGIGI